MSAANWTTISLAVMCLAVLCWQGSVLVMRKGYSSRFGVLTLSLAGLCALAQVCLLSGGLIFSNELHVCMAQGSFPRLVLGVFLVGAALAAGFGWFIALANGHSRWISGLGIIAASLIAGIAALFHIRQLNPQEITPLQVVSYDTLWPGLLLWLVLCLTQSAMAGFGSNRWGARTLATAMAIFFIGRWALHAPMLFDPLSRREWNLASSFSLSASIIVVFWWTLPRMTNGRKILRRFCVFIGILAAGACGILQYGGLSPLIARSLSIGLALAALFFAAVFTIQLPYKSIDRKAFKVFIDQLATTSLPKFFGRLRDLVTGRAQRFRRNWVLSLVLLFTFIGFLLASYLATTDPHFRLTGLSVGPSLDASVEFSGLIFIWIVLTEIFGMGPLTARIPYLRQRFNYRRSLAARTEMAEPH